MNAEPSLPFEFVSDLTGFRAADARIFRLGGALRRKNDLLRALASALAFPQYFGENWDALEECLQDLSWLPAANGLVLVHEQLPLADADQRRTYLQILAQRASGGQPPLRVVFPASAESAIRQLMS